MDMKKSQEKMHKYMNAYRKNWHLSASILIKNNDDVIFEETYGMANMEWNVPISYDTKFLIGSITKQFTAMAIMILVERGMISLDDKLNKYIPAFTQNAEKITIHHLLTHTSGINDFISDNWFNQKISKLKYEHKEFVSFFNYLPLESIPGEKFKYNNTGYYLLGVIIEQISEKPFDSFIKENIFGPIKMNNSGLLNENDIVPNIAHGYEFNIDKLENPTYMDSSKLLYFGGVYSTLRDLSLYDKALYSEEIVTKDSINKIYTTFKNNYGYGWFINEKFKSKCVSHSGGGCGFTTNIDRYIEKGIFIGILSNCGSLGVESICNDLASILFEESYNIPLKPKSIKIDTSNLKDYVGLYKDSNSNFYIKVTMKNEKLYMRYFDFNDFEIYPIGDGCFQHSLINQRYDFNKDEDGNVTLWGFSKK